MEVYHALPLAPRARTFYIVSRALPRVFASLGRSPPDAAICSGPRKAQAPRQEPSSVHSTPASSASSETLRDSGERDTSPLWTRESASALYHLPIPELLYRAQRTHRAHHEVNAVQLCTLLSIKTGACPEDCAYCPQSARHNTDLEPHRLLSVPEVLAKARRAKAAGASRFCMGAAWRDARRGKDFKEVLAMVRGVRALGLEACATLGMLSEEQAEALAEAGLTAYNHNLDSSERFYKKIISTRRYSDRIETLDRVDRAGISACSGGIIGMGETVDDRLDMLVTLANRKPQPESVPINALVPVEGTPLAERHPVDPLELARMCATARLMLPRAMVRLSAGRTALSREAQVLCFSAGANSIFYGERLLTTDNPGPNRDLELLRDAGLHPLEAPS